MTSGRVSFIGAGPGAADLITLRGAQRISQADIIVWAASLVDPRCIEEHARPDVELVDSSKITHEDVLAIFRRAASSHLRVARVHSGDPSLWGAVQEQFDACVRLGIEAEIVPGVSAFSAAAAIAGRELTIPEIAQSVILTRMEGGKTPMPSGEEIREFARHGTTMAIFLSAARSGHLADELRAGGYDEDTPVIIAYKVTWPDELLLHTTLGELEETVKQHKLWRHTLFLVGRSLRAEGTRSHLYNAGHFHTYRKADPDARRALRAVDADDTKAKAGWPLSTGRSGWVAARVGSEKWTKPSDGRSVAAWSAVQGWQATARNKSTKQGKASESSRSLRPVSVDQEAFDLGPATDRPEPTAQPKPAPQPQPKAAPRPEPKPRAEPTPRAAATPARTEQAKPKPKQAAKKTSAKRTNTTRRTSG